MIEWLKLHIYMSELKYNVYEQTDYVKCKFIMLVEDNARLHFVYVSAVMLKIVMYCIT